jgi:hypothetical protein
VKSVENSIEFCTESLGFQLDQQYVPAMAILSKGDLTLWLAGPASSAAGTVSCSKWITFTR